MTLKAWLADTAERALVTLVQAALVLAPLVFGPMNTSAAHTAVIVLLPAAVAIILNVLTGLLTFLPSASTNFYVDVAIRAVRTAITTFVALVGADQFDLFQANAWRVALVAVAMAVIAVVKAGIVERTFHPAQGRLTPASFAAKPTGA